MAKSSHSPAPISSTPSAPQTSTGTFPAYPVSPRVPVDESAALSPDQIPLVESTELDLPTDVETAEALGLGLQELSDEISEEESQRHPDVQGDDESGSGLAALAEEFDRRITGNSRG